MFQTLSGGTDGARMVLFDPDGIPATVDGSEFDFDLIDEFAADRKLIVFDPASDGAYTLGLCVQEDVPPRFRDSARELAAEAGAYVLVSEANPEEAAKRPRAELLLVPGGRLCFAGMECLFHENDRCLRQHPHMGVIVELPAGAYSVRVYENDYPEDFLGNELRERVDPGAYRFHRFLTGVMVLGCLSVGVTALLLCVVPFRIWWQFCLPATLALAIVPGMVANNSSSFQEVEMAEKALKTEYPDWLAVLYRVEPG